MFVFFSAVFRHISLIAHMECFTASCVTHTKKLEWCRARKASINLQMCACMKEHKKNRVCKKITPPPPLTWCTAGVQRLPECMSDGPGSGPGPITRSHGAWRVPPHHFRGQVHALFERRGLVRHQGSEIVCLQNLPILNNPPARTARASRKGCATVHYST